MSETPIPEKQVTVRPYIKWYMGDFLCVIADFTPKEIGVFSLILMHIHICGGAIPYNVKSISRRCNMRPTACEKVICSLFERERLILHDGNIYAPILDKWSSWNGRSSISSSVREFIFNRDCGRCVYCDQQVSEKFHIDHILPVCRGGSDDLENLALSCVTCNLSKGSKLLDEWLSNEVLQYNA